MQTFSFSFQFEESSHTARKINQRMFEAYQMEQAAPDEETAEAQWIADKKRLRDALGVLTSRQRQVYVLKVGYGLDEEIIAKKLRIKQQVVSRHWTRAQKKLSKYVGKIAER